jgi:hypothetical protein
MARGHYEIAGNIAVFEQQWARNAEYPRGVPIDWHGCKALFCTLARLTYRQICELVQRPSETGPSSPTSSAVGVGTRPTQAPCTIRGCSGGRSCRGSEL